MQGRQAQEHIAKLLEDRRCREWESQAQCELLQVHSGSRLDLLLDRSVLLIQWDALALDGRPLMSVTVDTSRV